MLKSKAKNFICSTRYRLVRNPTTRFSTLTRRPSIQTRHMKASDSVSTSRKQTMLWPVSSSLKTSTKPTRLIVLIMIRQTKAIYLVNLRTKIQFKWPAQKCWQRASMRNGHMTADITTWTKDRKSRAYKSCARSNLDKWPRKTTTWCSIPMWTR